MQGDARAFDAVVTMYHDQGQIAIKLMGFSRGVTVQGGLPIPIATPAHGTAFDIAGQGKGRRRRHPPGVRDRLPDGQAQSLIACMRRDNQSAAPS